MQDERFQAKLERQGDCLVYNGCVNEDGYGRLVRVATGNWAAHRYAWYLKHGPIPVDKKVLHTCDNPPCCNVDHLFLGTQKDNVVDMARKNRHGKIKFSLQVAEQIRQRYANGERGNALAREYDVSPSCISKIVNRLQRVV